MKNKNLIELIQSIRRLLITKWQVSKKIRFPCKDINPPDAYLPGSTGSLKTLQNYKIRISQGFK